MDREKKVGIIFIVVGICIPLMVLPFLSGYSKDKKFSENLYWAGIAIRKDKPSATEHQSPGNTQEARRRMSDPSIFIPKRIPFRFFLVITLVLLYMGIIRIDRSRRKKKDNRDSQKEEHD